METLEGDKKMAQAGISVQLSVKEIYEKCCPRCKEKIKQLVREKVSDEMVKQVIGA